MLRPGVIRFGHYPVRIGERRRKGSAKHERFLAGSIILRCFDCFLKIDQGPVEVGKLEIVFRVVVGLDTYWNGWRTGNCQKQNRNCSDQKRPGAAWHRLFSCPKNSYWGLERTLSGILCPPQNSVNDFDGTPRVASKARRNMQRSPCRIDCAIALHF